VVEAESLTLLDSANQLELTAAADRFATVAVAILEADAQATALRQEQRAALLAPQTKVDAAE
jgi:hypothetical protein